MGVRIGVMLRAVSERGGVGVYTANLTEHLLRLGPEHEWVLFYARASDMGRYPAAAHVREVLVPGRSKAVWDQVSIPRAARREGVDVLFHPKFTVPLLAHCPTVMTVHGVGWFVTNFFGALDVAYIRTVLPLYLRRATAVASVSERTTEFYNRRYRLPEGKIRTIYFGPAPNFRRIVAAEELETVRAKYRLPPRFILNLTKYRDAERKNIRGVLAAFREIASRTDHDLVVGGTDCERFREEYGVPAEGWGGRVHFPGWIDQQDLPAVYSLASVFLYPSFMEAFPIPLTEAMACGTPIVTSDRNGLAELAGDAAVQVDPDRPEAIAAGVERVLADPELRQALLAASHCRSELFKWDRCARMTKQLLEAAASRRSRAIAPGPVNAAGSL